MRLTVVGVGVVAAGLLALLVTLDRVRFPEPALGIVAAEAAITVLAVAVLVVVGRIRERPRPSP